MKHGNVSSTQATPRKEESKSASRPTSPISPKQSFRRIASFFQRPPSTPKMAQQSFSTEARSTDDSLQIINNNSDGNLSTNSEAFYMNMESSQHITRQSLVDGTIYGGDRGSKGDSSPT
ncbi:hypothetical protein PMZ80_006915 [Knufia obscura]|uniref:Uncharacterized protein n=2 Tax=Knufia TaxID=430999 RepID=A0AAN8IBP9_9EURO|nr:hypothetical protein PMZ80_006915 [Knufia obscura]KAK5957455.1 hypothetical protein OHC33_001830 [Knufia fluminis]